MAREEEDAQENTGPGRRGIPPGGTEASPEELYTAADGAETIREMIRSLHEPYLKVSVLYFLEEKDVDEIALTLGRPRKTVQTQLYRAKQSLQKMIREGA